MRAHPIKNVFELLHVITSPGELTLNRLGGGRNPPTGWVFPLLCPNSKQSEAETFLLLLYTYKLSF